MKIKYFLPLVFIFAVGILIFAIAFVLQKTGVPTIQNPIVLDYKNLTYTIEGRQIKLTNGFSQMESAPGSASKTTTQFFGNEAIGDINADGKEDIVFLLTQETGGSGTFYYLTGALENNMGGEVLNTVLLGDRIAPQTTQINNGVITVNYAQRKPGQPLTAAPTVGVSKYFKLQNGRLSQQMDQADFGKPVDLVVNQQVAFSDGLIVMLKQINDSRCKKGVVCIWAGELSPVFVINIDGVFQEIQLGTVMNKKVTKNGYVFELTGATETTATITVTKEVKTVGSCFIGGCSGEICSDKKDVVSTCIYNEQYACYKTATCAKQQNGQCGWTQDSALTACLNAKK